MEYRDLYDLNRNLTGEKILKGEEIPNNRAILMVVIFIENSKGQFLMQKRSKEKGGLWATTGGHPKTGESSLEGIITECNEELGIKINNPILFKKASGKQSFCDLYYLKEDINIDDIIIQKEEVDEVKWLSEDEIKELYNKGLFNKG
ncbi:MAG: NUDIX domain-containing protein, partial [Bacilli bacterium]|nr:NUDIX domain-containing protein [Bacilli bacterium]